MAGTLLIRADAGAKIGTGHVMRQLALAQAWQAAGGRAALLSHCPVEGFAERVRAAGVAFEPLEHRHPNPADLAATLARLRNGGLKDSESRVPWVALDGYHFDPAYQEAIRQTGCRLVVVDDMAHWPGCHADLLVNQNLGSDRLTYACDEHATLMLGPHYALLRPEFHGRGLPRRTVPDTARRVLVTLGGEDSENATRLVVEALGRLDVPGLEARVVVGPANRHLETLHALVERSPAGIRLLANVVNMPELMAWADVAVSAAGTTCWELALMQLPAAVLVLADNQQRVAERLAEAGVVVNLGPPEGLTAQAVASEVDSLCRDRRRRMAQSEAGRCLVDGRGAERVVAVMHALDRPIGEDQLTLRPINAEDMLAVWRLANVPSVRRNSLSPDPIPLRTHRTWFDEKLASPDTCMWALDFHGLLFGQVRYDRAEAATAEVSLSVAPAFRKRGLGTMLLERTRRPAAERLAAQRIRAVVRQDNPASIRAFLKAGFTEVASEHVRGHACRILERAAGDTEEHSRTKIPVAKSKSRRSLRGFP